MTARTARTDPRPASQPQVRRDDHANVVSAGWLAGAEASGLYRAGWTVEGIAAHLGVKPHSVVTYAVTLRNRGVQIPRAPQMGGTPRRLDWAAAARMHREGMTLTEIGRRYGVKRNAVYRALLALAADGVEVGPRGRWPKPPAAPAAPAPAPRSDGPPIPVGRWAGISGYRI